MGCLELATGEANVCIVGVGLTVDQACPLQCWFQIFSYGDRDGGGGGRRAGISFAPQV